MPPKRSTRSSTRASQNGKSDPKDDSKQATLEETGEGVVDHKTGEKRPAPEKDDKELISADEKKDGTRANKEQKEEAANKSKIEGGADELDEKSEDAKAKGREIMENSNTETKKPSRGTLEKGTVYFWYKPKGEFLPPIRLIRWRCQAFEKNGEPSSGCSVPLDGSFW